MHRSPSGRVYIGISKNPERRWNRGNGYKYNPYFWRCIKKYGWDGIEHIILFDGLTMAEAKEKEIELISEYKSNNRQYGYNISPGGDGPASDESRKKMSEARIGNKNCLGRKYKQDTKDKIACSLKEYYSTHTPSFSGRRHSRETILRLKSRVFSDETRRKMRKKHPSTSGSYNPSAKPISCYTIDGVLVKTYSYAKMAAEEIGVSLSSIIKCCRGKINTCKGYVWRYA